MDYQYAYIIGNIFFLLVWIFLFWIRGDLRKKMLTMSLLIAPLGFTQFFYLRDYWHPSYFLGTIFGIAGIEDILFCFFIGGITAVLYEEIFGIRYAKRHIKNHLFWMFVFAIFGILWIFVGNIILGFNSIYVSSSILFLTGIFIVILRHDLLKDAFLSGALTGILMFVFYLLFLNTLFGDIVQKWWLLKNISGILILGVPLEELAWAFSWGFVAGPTYEFITGLKFKKIS